MEITPGVESVIYHFSHVHQLQIQPYFIGPNQTRIRPSCCEPTANPATELGPIYGCESCNFFIHRACSELLPMVRHPAHPDHTLTLVASSPYLKGSVVCDACTTTITNFFYHCTHCSFDVHTHCAFLPSITNHSSHSHTLSLFFSSSYETESRVCDLCRESVDGRSWIYRCTMCGFDAHVHCALAWPGGVVVGSPTFGPMNPFVDLAPTRQPDSPTLVAQQGPPFGTALDHGPNPNPDPEIKRHEGCGEGSMLGDEFKDSFPEYDDGDRDVDVERLQMILAKMKTLTGGIDPCREP